MNGRSDEAGSPSRLCDVEQFELDSQRVGYSLRGRALVERWVALVSSPEGDKISLDFQCQRGDKTGVDSSGAQGPHGHVAKEGVVHGNPKRALQFGHQGGT